MEVQIAIDFATIMVIGIPEAETDNLAKAVAGRCPQHRNAEC